MRVVAPKVTIADERGGNDRGKKSTAAEQHRHQSGCDTMEQIAIAECMSFRGSCRWPLRC
jgi:hypothetical protein